MLQHGATVVHHIPGRLRVRLPRANRRPDILRDLHSLVKGLGGVKGVEINPVTGSILIHYEPGSEVHDLFQGHEEALPEVGEGAEIIDAIEKEAEFLAGHSQLALQLVNGVKALNSTVRDATGNAVDLKVLLPGGLAVWAFFKMGAEIATPLWVTLAIFSFNSFVALHHPHTVRVTQQFDQQA